jgi:eukaryotic-like serine/threonine-protein kinase
MGIDAPATVGGVQCRRIMGPPTGTGPTAGATGEASGADRILVSPPDPLVGTTLAERYEIIRRIGEGGMGAVYEARHTVLGKRVAVKVLLEKFFEKPELVARLLQEARLASSIGHENIVDVTDFGTTVDGRAFVVMEFLEGESLAQLTIREAPLPVERSLYIARQVASAVGAAHAKGIVHRDVKPENVYLIRRAEADFVKVVDFGVSKAVQSREEGAEWQRLTRTGMVLGTPLYMSPEQARGGEDVDNRADIWALGVMMYECLTGEVPFRANNYLGVISQVLTQEAVTPTRLRPELGIPPAVEKVVMRALEKDRDKRYQSMAVLERDLDRLLGGEPALPESTVTVPTEPSRPAVRWHLALGAVILISLGVAASLARTEAELRKTATVTATVTATAQKPSAPVKKILPAPKPLDPETVVRPSESVAKAQTPVARSPAVKPKIAKPPAPAPISPEQESALHRQGADLFLSTPPPK